MDATIGRTIIATTIGCRYDFILHVQALRLPDIPDERPRPRRNEDDDWPVRPQTILEMALGEPGALDRDLPTTKESAAAAGLANKSALRARVLVANACQQGLSLK